MQFDLTRLPSAMPQLPPLGGQARRPLGTIRVVTYVILAILAVWLLLWSRAQSTKLVRQSAMDTTTYQAEAMGAFAQYLAAQPTPATTLTAKGLAVVETNPLLASAWLGAAAERDPQYRDAVLGAGFAALKLAEALWSTDAAGAQEHTETAQHYLEAAKAIDPIYAYTYELLALTYANLGEAELAADATKKAHDFAAKS